MNDPHILPTELVLGTRLNNRVPVSDQKRQRTEVVEILRRLQRQPGVILADEVGMGKTFVALAIAYSIARQSARGPVIVMVPANLVDKWEQDLRAFCELYLEDRQPLRRETAPRKDLTSPSAIRYGVARHSVDLMKLLDDPPRDRCHLIFLAQGAMARRQTDKWIRLALIAEALRRHGRGAARRLIKVKKQIHRFLAELLWAIGEERAHDWGEELWQLLLRTSPKTWKDTYNTAVRDQRRHLTDDPVPKAVLRALPRVDLKPLAEALESMPVRATGGNARTSERLNTIRRVLREVEEELWKDLLAQARWRSPLLVMDEAHHLKNPGTALARQLQSPDTERDLRTGDGAMAQAFDRMLFLTATPFQLGHHELVRVLERFADVRWDRIGLGDIETFRQRLSDLGEHLNESQRTAIALQRSWSRIRREDCEGDIDSWWTRLLSLPRDQLTPRQRAVVDAFHTARRARDTAQESLRPWIVRYNKEVVWAGTEISRRQRMHGAAICGQATSVGIAVPPQQLLPFFLAARSVINPGQELLGEALCSSFEAFRFTREGRNPAKDEQDELPVKSADLAHSGWYLREFDEALKQCSGATHPKISATVHKAVDLWEAGEKVLVFAFYRHTCRALRVHISQQIKQRVLTAAQRRLREAGQKAEHDDVDRLIDRIQDRYFDDLGSPRRRAIDAALAEIVQSHAPLLAAAQMGQEARDDLMGVMRQFLRVWTTLARSFPIAEIDTVEPVTAVTKLLDHVDASGMSWRQKFADFIEFLTSGCSSDERRLYLGAVGATKTGGIRVEDEEDERSQDTGRSTLASVRVAIGTTRRETRARLMRAFNTPFFPDVLVCSQVMGEGVDLQRFCRHVIHHDLDWNPSTIEQRTGRVDRLGCKAEGRQPIVVYTPYLAGTADERQYRVMSDREQWFRVVMGQDEVARLIAPDVEAAVRLPEAIPAGLSFRFDVDGSCDQYVSPADAKPTTMTGP